MLNPDLFAEFLAALRSGKAFDTTGKKHKSSRLEKAFKEISEKRVLFRGEWLDLETLQGRKVTYHKFDDAGNLIEVTEPLDEDTLMHDKKISLENWLNKDYRTSQGLPRKNIPDGDLWYWHPRENKVTGFYAVAYGAYLDCDGGPLYSDAGLGVRAAKIFHKKK